MNASELGERAECAARAYLQRQGLSFLEKNYRCRWGEVDLIMRHAEAIVFVEVRFRSRADFGGAFASVDRRKQAKLVRTAQHFLQRNASAEASARIDVVSCTPGAQGELEINWLPNAVCLDA